MTWKHKDGGVERRFLAARPTKTPAAIGGPHDAPNGSTGPYNPSGIGRDKSYYRNRIKNQAVRPPCSCLVGLSSLKQSASPGAE